MPEKYDLMSHVDDCKNFKYFCSVYKIQHRLVHTHTPPNHCQRKYLTDASTCGQSTLSGTVASGITPTTSERSTYAIFKTYLKNWLKTNQSCNHSLADISQHMGAYVNMCCDYPPRFFLLLSLMCSTCLHKVCVDALYWIALHLIPDKNVFFVSYYWMTVCNIRYVTVTVFVFVVCMYWVCMYLQCPGPLQVVGEGHPIWI